MRHCERRSRRVDEASVGVYLSGANTRRIRGALAPLLQSGASIVVLTSGLDASRATAVAERVLLRALNENGRIAAFPSPLLPVVPPVAPVPDGLLAAIAGEYAQGGVIVQLRAQPDGSLLVSLLSDAGWTPSGSPLKYRSDGWFASDQDPLKAFKIVDADLLAVSNGAEISRTARPDGKHVVRFEETIPMSTYVVAFVVGPLEASAPVDVDGIPLRIIHVPGKGHLTELGLRAGAHGLRWFQQYYGIDYPTGKCDMLALPDFAAGAMENLGCITFRENLLLADARRSGKTSDKAVLAHVLSALNYSPSNLAGFPSCAFDRPIEAKMTGFGRSAVPGLIEATPIGSACPVGGIGAGGFERLMDGTFSTWFLKLGWMVEDTVWADQFHVFIKSGGRTIAKTLSTTAPPAGSPACRWARNSPSETSAQGAAAAGVAVFHLAGWLDMQSEKLFVETVQKAKDDGAQYVLLDMRDMDTITSSGIRAIQQAYKILTPKADTYKVAYLKLCNAPPQVYQVLGITGLLVNVPMYESQDDALESFGK